MRLSTGIWLATALLTAAITYALTYIACGLFYLSYVNYIVDNSLCFTALAAGLIPVGLVLFFEELARSAVIDWTQQTVVRS